MVAAALQGCNGRHCTNFDSIAFRAPIGTHLALVCTAHNTGFQRTLRCWLRLNLSDLTVCAATG